MGSMEEQVKIKMKDYITSSSSNNIKIKTLRHWIYDNMEGGLSKDVIKQSIQLVLIKWEKRGKVSNSEDGKTFEWLSKKRKRSEPRDVDPGVTVSDCSIHRVPSEDAVDKGNATILLFYAYAEPQFSRAEQDEAIAFCYNVLSSNGMSGRLRVGREGFNATLTGYKEATRIFTSSLKNKWPRIFGATDFKYVDNLSEKQLLKGLKVFPVTEIVTYGFNPQDAPLELGGVHLKPEDFHKAMEDPNSVVIDVRNVNESAIGKFAPPGDKVLDPLMRRSTEFPEWIDNNRDKLVGKKILMYCTAGVRCERASAFIRKKGYTEVYQLDGGIHRYLDAYPEDGGYWVGKNYTFDKRFSHGAKNAEVISSCITCESPWDRYQAQKKCPKCKTEVLVCKACERLKPAPPAHKFLCALCK